MKLGNVLRSIGGTGAMAAMGLVAVAGFNSGAFGSASELCTTTNVSDITARFTEYSDSVLTGTDCAAVVNLDDIRDDVRFDQYDGSGQAIVFIGRGFNCSGSEFLDADSNSRVDYSYDFYDADTNVSTNSIIDDEGTLSVSIAAGSTYGVAPNARIILLKVADNSGSPCAMGTFEAALQWVADNVGDYNIVAVNLPFSCELTGYGELVAGTETSLTYIGMSDELEILKKLGVTLVASAGDTFDYYDAPANSELLSYPAMSPSTIAAGSLFTSDYATNGNVTYNSAIGSVWGTGYSAGMITPDSLRSSTMTQVFAPGVGVPGVDRNGNEAGLTGTGAASAYVCGAVALLQDMASYKLERAMTPDEVENALTTYCGTVSDLDASYTENIINTGSDYNVLDFAQVMEEIYGETIAYDGFENSVIDRTADTLTPGDYASGDWVDSVWSTSDNNCVQIPDSHEFVKLRTNTISNGPPMVGNEGSITREVDISSYAGTSFYFEYNAQYLGNDVAVVTFDSVDLLPYTIVNTGSNWYFIDVSPTDVDLATGGDLLMALTGDGNGYGETYQPVFRVREVGFYGNEITAAPTGISLSDSCNTGSLTDNETNPYANDRDGTLIFDVTGVIEDAEVLLYCDLDVTAGENWQLVGSAIGDATGSLSITTSYAYDSAGDYDFCVTQAEYMEGESVVDANTSITVYVYDQPDVLSASVNGAELPSGDGHGSYLGRVSFTFTQDVTVAEDDLQIYYYDSGWYSIDIDSNHVTMNYDSETYTATWDFDPTYTEDWGALQYGDGWYYIALDRFDVTNDSSNSLVEPMYAADDFLYGRLVGAIEGDTATSMDVDTGDYDVLQLNYNWNGSWSDFMPGDLNLDGTVSMTDFLLWSSNNGQSLSSPPSITGEGFWTEW